MCRTSSAWQFRAENLGLDSVWASDHVFNVSYVFERIGNRPYYDPLTILTYVAARTERIALGTSVLVLPYHQPMRLAKTAATLDVMSGGRLLLGVGVGVVEQELNAMGSPYHERGAITMRLSTSSSGSGRKTSRVIKASTTSFSV